MRNIIFIVGVISASFAQAKTIDVSELSDYEKMVHRISWCYWFVRGQSIRDDRIIHKVYHLLYDNDFFEEDRNGQNVRGKAKNDIQAERLFGRIMTREEWLQCEKDSKAILKKEYIPNFTYLTETE